MMKATKIRVSRRSFDGVPAPKSIIDVVAETCEGFRPFGDARVVLVSEPAVDVFTGVFGTYGKIVRPPHLLTVIVGHATFCIVLVYNNVIARLRRTGRSLEEASADLGADAWETFRRVSFPQVRSAMLAGTLLAFALSFDEVIVTIFTAGGVTTLPIWIFQSFRLAILTTLVAVPIGAAFARPGAEVWAIAGDGGFRVSVRNKLPGKIIDITRGAVNTEVNVEVSGRNTINAVITNECAESLGLGVGDPVSAMFKASSVILGVG